jgi:hypothetical protein
MVRDYALALKVLADIHSNHRLKEAEIIPTGKLVIAEPKLPLSLN